MKILKYFFARGMLPLYAAFAVIFGIFAALVTKSELSYHFMAGVFFLALLLRFTDDLFDYEKDRNKKAQYLSKKVLKIFLPASAFLFVIFNALAFGAFGLLSIIFVAYVLAEEKFQILQSFFTFLFSLYSLFALSKPGFELNVPIFIFLALSLILPVLFGIYKRSKRK